MNIVNIRASSLAELFDCPARWAAKHVDGLRLPKTSAAQLGTAVHAGTAAFDNSRLKGGTPITADDAASVVVDFIYEPEEEVNWEGNAQNDVESIAVKLHMQYCTQIAPRQVYRGVEIHCEKLEISDLGISLTGTTDRVRETSTGLGISDIKTGKLAVGTDGKVVTKGHAIQLGVYELLAEHAMGLSITAPAQIVGMNTGKTQTGQRIGTGEVHSAKDALLGTEEQHGLLQHASKLIHSGMFYGNSKSVLCSARYCPAHPTCTWRD